MSDETIAQQSSAAADTADDTVHDPGSTVAGDAAASTDPTFKEDRTLVERYVNNVTGRLGAGAWLTKTLRKVFPSHFSFLWGELALYSFVILVLTGVYLTLFFAGSQDTLTYTGSYVPLQGQEVSSAFNSVMRISFEVKGGRLIRQMHHWAALVFMGAIALHMARIYFTGAYRRPRDLNWYVGLTLLVLALAAGFTGYSLPDDLLSGTGLRITYAIILAIPFVGERLVYLIFGGEWPGTEIIGRLYPVHILIIPGLIAALLALHLGMVWHQKHTQFRGPGRTEDNVVGERVWPSFALKSIGLFFLVAGMITMMGALFTINPIWLYGPYDIGAATSFSQPDWYIGFLEGSLRLMPPWETRIGPIVLNNIFYSGVIVSGLIFGGLYLVPWLDRRLTGDYDEHNLLDRPRDAPNRTAFGVACITFVSILFIGGAQDIVAKTFDIAVGRVTTILQIAILIAPPLSFFIARRVCISLRDRPGPRRTERESPVVRTSSGGYEFLEPIDSEGAPVDQRNATNGGTNGSGNGHVGADESDTAREVAEP
ncbi:MAG: cytochrome bc complex cytochrome b subunit [Actinomycetota bacterium]